MSKAGYKRESKTMTEVTVIDFKFIKDDSDLSASRTQEVRNLIAQMIEMSHKRGRPSKQGEEIPNAA
jgi:hypothetical protein